MSESDKDDENVKIISIPLDVFEKEGIVINTGEKLVIRVIELIVDLSE